LKTATETAQSLARRYLVSEHSHDVREERANMFLIARTPKLSKQSRALQFPALHGLNG